MNRQDAQNTRIIADTERLLLREMNEGDLDALCTILCDAEVMRAAYETPFTPEQAQAWLGRHLKRYRELGFGLWAVVLKETGAMIGQCGLTLQPWAEGQVLELGYLFAKEHWHRGYATEAALACMDYAFSTLHADSVCSIIRDTHYASRQVAERCGMQAADRAVKVFRDVEMQFMLYRAERPGSAE